MSASNVENLIAGFILGITGSYLSWLFITKVFVPNIEVSKISRLIESDDPTRVQYRIKLYNHGRRPVTDLSIACRIWVKGLNPASDRGSNKTSFHIPVGDEWNFPFLESKEGRIYTLRVKELRGGRPDRLPEGVLEGLRNGNFELEDLLELGGGGYLRIAVSGAHGSSGLRKAKAPLRKEITPGTFVHHNSCEILYNPSYERRTIPKGD
jgi:hypothetical protein